MSARFIMAVMFCSTFCVAVLMATWAFINKILPIDGFLAILGPFILVVREVAAAYFDRNDRANIQTTKSVQPEVKNVQS
jgi:hypothetical protein